MVYQPTTCCLPELPTVQVAKNRWSRWRDSNSRPHAPKACRLPLANIWIRLCGFNPNRNAGYVPGLSDFLQYARMHSIFTARQVAFPDFRFFRDRLALMISEWSKATVVNSVISISVIHKIWTPESYRTRTSLKGFLKTTGCSSNSIKCARRSPSTPQIVACRDYSQRAAFHDSTTYRTSRPRVSMRVSTHLLLKFRG